MIKETLTYTDYNGEERTAEYRFHMSQVEWIRFDRKYGGIQSYLEKAIRNGDEYAAMNMFEDLVQTAYGEKSSDGIRFEKSKEITDSFVQTEAYSNFIYDMLTNESRAIDFFNRLKPADNKSVVNSVSNK